MHGVVQYDSIELLCSQRTKIKFKVHKIQMLPSEIVNPNSKLQAEFRSPTKAS